MDKNEELLSGEVAERNWQRAFDEARRAHDKNHETSKQMYASVLDFSLLAMKTVTVISGGAVVVMLAFIGALYTSNTDLATSLFLPAAVYASGAVLGSVATSLGYITQYRYHEAYNEVTLEWSHPFVSDKPEKAAFLERAVFWHKATVWCIGITYGCLFLGIVLTVTAVNLP